MADWCCIARSLYNDSRECVFLVFIYELFVLFSMNPIVSKYIIETIVIFNIFSSGRRDLAEC